MTIRKLPILLVFSLGQACSFAPEASAASTGAANATTYFEVKPGSHPHDVAVTPAADGPVYFTAQNTGKLGILDPKTGHVDEVELGPGSAPHGVIVGPDGAAWITDGGLNAIVRYDPKSRAVQVWPLPADAANANLNTPTFDQRDRVWFTGQSGYYGRLVVDSGHLKVWKAPRGRGPYGITTTPSGQIYYASLAGNHIARIDPESGEATVIEPPTAGQGARRVWSDSNGNIWVSYSPCMSGATIRTARRGGSGNCRVTRTPMRSGSTTRTRCGSRNGAAMRLSDLTRSLKNSSLFRRAAPMLASGNSWAATVKSGVPSRVTTDW